jgi:purine-binding chemotaxis protein CheW
MRLLPIAPLAGASPLVLGLCVIRGAPVPVVDTAMLFDDRASRCERLVTIRMGQRTIAFAADVVLGLQAIEPRELSQLPPLLRNVEAIAALNALDEELVFFLHTARTVSDDIFELVDANGARA